MAAVTGNVAVEEEVEILTEAGTVRAGPSLETATATPPSGAGLESVMVQVVVAPALRLVESQATAATDASSSKVAVAEPFKLAVMVPLWFFVTPPAVAVKVADVASAGTGTDVGIVNSELLEVKATVCGLTPSLFNVTVQVLEPREINDVGLQLREDTACVGSRSKETLWETPFRLAVRITVTLVAMAPAVAVKATEGDPAGTVAELGTISAVLLSERATTLPPVGAAWLRVTVQVVEAPEFTLVGLQNRAVTGTLWTMARDL
jgi:hypothetical protein